jgi:hypothetical protein
MSRKSIAIGLILVLVIGMAIGYFLQKGIPNLSTSTSNQYVGYTQVKVYENGLGGLMMQKVGSYNYFLDYFPSTIGLAMNTTGYVSIEREDITYDSEFPLNIGVTNTYNGIEFIITDVQPEYCILMVK